jgi:hypothetical protein
MWQDIQAPILSLLEQTHSNIFCFIRHDSSVDKTVLTIQEYRKDSVKIIKGEKLRISDNINIY